MTTFNTSNLKISGNPQSGMVMKGTGMGTMKMTRSEGGGMRMEGSKVSMEAFALMLSSFVDRPVMDMTDLKGFFQVGFDLSMEDMMGAARAAGAGGGMVMVRPGAGHAMPGGGNPADSVSEPSGGSSIFASVQQLGLKLDPRKAPVDRVVIDQCEKMPTEN